MSNPVSYIHGTSLTPLIGETVGANFDRIVGLYPDRDAVVVRHQAVRWTYAEFGVRVDRVARALVGDRDGADDLVQDTRPGRGWVGGWRSDGDLGAQLRRVAIGSVCLGQGGGDPG